MAISPEILNEAELTRVKIAQAECIDDDYKKQLLNILNITTQATNGISPEQKIQKMTEAIYFLALSQIQFMTTVENTVKLSIEKANMRQCHQCKAMQHAVDIEEQSKHERLIQQWKEANQCTVQPEGADTWQGILRGILMKPYIYIFLTLTAISPYGVQIIEKILNFYK